MKMKMSCSPGIMHFANGLYMRKRAINGLGYGRKDMCYRNGKCITRVNLFGIYPEQIAVRKK